MPSFLVQTLNRFRLGALLLLAALCSLASPNAWAAADQTTWNANCTGCHTAGSGPAGAQLNGAGAVAVINAANSRHSMGFNTATQATLLSDMAAFLASVTNTAASTVHVAYHGSASVSAPNLTFNDAGAGVGVLTGYGYASSSTTYGTLSGAGTTALSYTHTANSCGSETLTVYGQGAAQTSNRTIPITIDAPTLTTPTGVTFNIAYSTGATSLSPLGTANLSSISGVGTPAYGSAGLVNANAVSYASSATVYTPQVTFSYLGQGPSGCGVSSSGSVVVNISAPPAPSVGDIGSAGNPIIVSNIASTPFDVSTYISGVVQDANGTSYAVSASQPTAGGSGSSSVSGNTITYIPPGNFTGATTITYTKAGPGGTSASKTIYLNVNSAPTVSAASATTSYNTPITINLSGSITSGITVTSVTPSSPSNGSAVAVGSGSPTSIQFTPTNNFYGNASFLYTATNGAGTSTTAQVSVTVRPPLPTVSNTTATVTYNTATAINLVTAITPGASVTSVTPSGAVNGTAVATGPTTVTFTPTPGTLGAASFAYTATNATGTSVSSATVTINIPTPGAPVAGTQSVTAVSGGATPIHLATSITGVYTSTALGTLPSHGTATLSGSTVSYTPQSGYQGPDSFTYTATGPGGPSSAATVSINVLTTPVAPNVTRSTPLNTNLVLDTTSFASGSFTSVTTSTASHGTLAVSGNTITYTPGTGYYGADSFTYTLMGGAAGNASGTITVNVMLPAVATASLSVALNSSGTLDLAPFITGTAISGIRIASAPGHGSVTVSGTSVTYTPTHDYFGTDSFTYAGFGAYGLTTPAVVTVTISGRPDPTQNAAVTGLVANQVQTALRFSQAQVSNFGRHMESLRRPGGLGGQRSNLDGLAPAQTPTLSNLGAGNAAPLPSPATAGLQGSNPTQLPTGTSPTASLPVESGVSMALAQLGVPNTPLVGLLYNAKNGSLDLGAVQAAFGSGRTPGASLPGTSVWVEGVVSFGTRDASGAVSASEYSSSGISVGVDMPVSDAFTWGLGVGLARDVAYIGTDGSRNQSQGYSLAVYGSYLLGDNAFVEGMLGAGTINYDMRRWVDPAADYALSNRKGYQVFGSVGTGLEFRRGPRMVSPYVRLDFAQDTLDEVTETGAGSYALHYYKQTNNSSQAVLGLRGETTHSTAFGWAVPRARVEWRQDLMDGSNTLLSYADQIGSTLYSIAPTDGRRSALVLGLGSEFLFRDGWSFGLDYQLSRVSNAESSYALRLRLTKELGAKGQRKLLQGDEEIPDGGNEITVDSSATWDDNITRAKLGDDIRADMVYTVNLSRTLEYRLSGNTRVLLTGLATGERFQNFNGLSHIGLGAEANLQYRASSEFDAPTWGLVGKLVGEDYQSSLRDGTRASLGLTWLQPMTDRITLFGALMYNTRQTNNTVFNTEDTSLRLNVDYALGRWTTLYLTGEYRDGDIVSTGHQSLENITIAKAVVQDDAFPNGEFFSYRFKGTTALLTLGYNIGLGPRDSLDLSWRYVQSTPQMRPAWATSPASYTSNQISATYLMRF